MDLYVWYEHAALAQTYFESRLLRESFNVTIGVALSWICEAIVLQKREGFFQAN